jgi:ribosomal-protein-alanine N-acetyltransferase
MHQPPYTPFPTITGEKFSLRQITDADITQLLEISFYDGILATSVPEAIAMNSKINQDYLEGKSIHWGITDNLNGKLTGTCGYYRGFEKDEGELGCVLLPQFRGQGIMTTALKLGIDFGIHTMALQRIRAVTTRQNISANRLLERLNFVKVSELKDDAIEYQLSYVPVAPDRSL